MRSPNYDVIIIGSGASGGCAAHRLAKMGMKVLVLEKGPSRTLGDFLEGGAFGSRFTSVGRGDELKYINGQYLMPRAQDEVRYLDYTNNLGDKGKGGEGDDKNVYGRTGRGFMSQLVGGGTIHYDGASFRYEKVDFTMKKTFQDSLEQREAKIKVPKSEGAELNDWPVKFQTFEKFYAQAEKIIGISGAPNGLPALPPNRASEIIINAQKAGCHDAIMKPTPIAISSRRQNGRDRCHYSGLCQSFACRWEAKSDMRVTTLREALATGLVQIQANTFVRKIEVRDKKVKELECIVGEPGRDATVQKLSAPWIIVGCEALETNRLIMASGLGNPAIVGRYLMFKMTGGARSFAKEPTTTWDTPPHTHHVDDYYLNQSDKGAGSDGHGPFLKTGILLIGTADGPLLASSDIWGDNAREYFEKIFQNKMDFSYIGEGLPKYSNRVELVKNQTDRYGMPGIRITYSPHPFDIYSGRYMKRKALEILKASGGSTVNTKDVKPWLQEHLKKSTTARKLYHGCGGLRMGDDPRTSVVNRDGRMHDVDNLFIADASTFPTSGGRNPTLTIQANGFRVAECVATLAGKTQLLATARIK